MENNKKGGFGRRTEGRREYGSNTGKRPRISRAGTRGAERVFGDNNERPRRSFGDNSERRSFGGDRPRRSFGENSERPRRSFGDNSERRSFGEGRSFGSDRPRRSFSENSERPRRNFGDNSERRSFGGDRPRRSSGENSERRPFSGERRSGGFRNTGKKSFTRKDFNYFRDENESGINQMINRRPQLDGEYSDNDMVMVPVKEEIRLNKFIANSGVCSRREADNFILAGVVTVNGEVVTELGTKVNINTDDIRFNGERLKGENKVYIVMNKPKGYVTTASDPHADKTVMDLLKSCPTRVFPVGRLDKNTTGVLMFTNDGEIAEKLTHPSYDKKKIYQVSLDSKLKQEDFEKILSGVELNDGIIAADELEYIEADDHRKLGIEIHSGKNRIVRRIFESLGYEVKALDRVYFAGLTKKGIKRGDWRYLTEGEINLLRMGAYL
ncbi:MAG: pseudouridine synthase [Bacteroidales bacterium]|nr:pseudouridine synthase [Bacteroidales bacterium]